MTNHNQTMTTPSARICTCGTGPNVSRCPDGHLEPTRRPKGKSTKCPHHEDGVNCGRWAWVLARPPATASGTPTAKALPAAGPDPALMRMWASMPEWAGEIFWREEPRLGILLA